MATFWTLAYFDGQKTTEKQFPDWGITHHSLSFSFENKRKGSCSFATVENVDAAGGTQFTAGLPIASHQILVYQNRQSANGAPNSFGGGTIYFQGFVDDARQAVSDGKQYVYYQVFDVLWLFERDSFKQYRYVATNWNTVNGKLTATVTPTVSSEIYLFEKVDTSTYPYNAVQQDCRAQIGEICDWLNRTYNPTWGSAAAPGNAAENVVIPGAIDPQIMPAIRRYNELTCDQAIKAVLESVPDAVIAIDHSTRPPTLNVRTLSRWNYATKPPTFLDYKNLPEVVVPVTAQKEKELSVQTKKSAILPGVIIYYHTSATVNGYTSYAVYKDIADAYGSALYLVVNPSDLFPTGLQLISGGNPEPLVNDWTPEVSSHSVQLAGSNVSFLTCAVTTADASALANGSAGDILNWLITHDKSLRPATRGGVAYAGGNPRIDGDSFALAGPITVTDDNGVAIDLSKYPNELASKSLPDWTGCKQIRATVRARVSYQHYSDDARTVLDHHASAREVSHTVTLTNAITKTYTQEASAISAEVIPQNVALSAYRSASADQTAGSIELIDSPLADQIKIGTRLTLVGPNTTFQNCLVQSISAQPQKGYLRVTFGPCAPIDINAWVTLGRSMWSRTVYNMPSGRADGTGLANSTDQSATNAGDNTAHGVGGVQYDAVTFVHE